MNTFLKQIRITLADPHATERLGGQLAKCLTPGLVCYLYGDLGAGKTSLVRAILRGLGYEGNVKSPTYTLVESYVISSLNLYHFDLYRFADPEEWEDSGFREYFNPASTCFVEWPEKATGVLPGPDLEIRLDIQAVGRAASLQAWTEAGKQCLIQLQNGSMS